MATSTAPTPSAPAVATQRDDVPRPVAPLGGALVDATAATFVWHGVAGATRYTVQVASDPAFADDVLELDAGTATELTLFSTLPAGDAELYWRVRAETPGGAPPYSGYGRFVAATDDAVDAYRAEQEAQKAATAKEIAKARAEHRAESDLIPPYERPESVTHTALLVTMTFLLLSFLLVIGVVMAIMHNAPG